MAGGRELKDFYSCRGGIKGRAQLWGGEADTTGGRRVKGV
jgi:hypothetical protein